MSESPSDEDTFDYAEIGFLFEGSEESKRKHYEFHNEFLEVRLALNVVDNEPGAVQSGHYLWPGALALGEYLLERSSLQPKTVLELGSGCALVSLTALQVFSSIQYLVITDHDPGTLQRAKDNHNATLEYLDDDSLVRRILHVPTQFEIMVWGDLEAAMGIASNLKHDVSLEKFDLILGSDLIYDRDVVRPLLQTVSYMLEANGIFLLSQSFIYDDTTERNIDELCSQLKLKRIILHDDLCLDGGSKIQEFTWIEGS
jgi:predicted nicotinamide N-methyase